MKLTRYSLQPGWVRGRQTPTQLVQLTDVKAVRIVPGVQGQHQQHHRQRRTEESFRVSHGADPGARQRACVVALLIGLVHRT